MKLKLLSLFSGCGGLDLGFLGDFYYRKWFFEANDYDLTYAVDFDKDAVNVYNANSKFFRGHECLQKDVRDVSDDEIPDFDVLIAGFPCQPFSNAGNRQGINDQHGRGNLFQECERFIRVHQKKTLGDRPLGFVFENVRGILSSRLPNGLTVPQEIINRMKKMGYNTTCQLIRASDYGVPQNRFRVFMIGIREDLPMFDFEKLKIIVEEKGLPNAKDPYDLLLGSILSDIPEDATHKKDIWAYSPGGQSMIEKIGICPDGSEALEKFRENVPLEEISKTITEGRSWKKIPFQEMPSRFQRIFLQKEKYRAPNFYRRFALGEIQGTITASAQPENCGITHPFENRRFSIREIARIQSFPDNFVFPYSSIPCAYKVIGNAVPPILGWVVAVALERHLKEALG